jgi:hypothetical protein
VLAAKITHPYDGKVAGRTHTSGVRFATAVYEENETK